VGWVFSKYEKRAMKYEEPKPVEQLPWLYFTKYTFREHHVEGRTSLNIWDWSGGKTGILERWGRTGESVTNSLDIEPVTRPVKKRKGGNKTKGTGQEGKKVEKQGSRGKRKMKTITLVGRSLSNNSKRKGKKGKVIGPSLFKGGGEQKINQKRGGEQGGRVPGGFW